MGCIIYELCSLKRAFRELMHDESQITDWKIGKLPAIFSSDLESILKFILTPDDETRPSALMVLHHPILKTRKKSSGGILETDFPVSSLDVTQETFNAIDTSVGVDPVDLNHFLSMMSDTSGREEEEDPSILYDDVQSIKSLEIGTTMPKATSSVLHSPAVIKSNRAVEAHLQRWAGMLALKEQELMHKEKRLQLWETQLMEMQLHGQSNKPNSSYYPANESSGVETDLDSCTSSTASVYPGDSILIPTAVRLEPSKIRNPFAHYQEEPERRVRFDEEEEITAVQNMASQQFAQQRLRWLEMKRKKHQANSGATKPEETDYFVMEEKSILPASTSTSTRRRLIKLSPGKAARIPSSRKDKENVSQNPSKFTDPLSSELRAKLKSHNLPGLR